MSLYSLYFLLLAKLAKNDHHIIKEMLETMAPVNQVYAVLRYGSVTEKQLTEYSQIFPDHKK